MDKVVSSSRLKNDPICRGIISHLDDITTHPSLENAILYYDFPLFRDYEDELYQPSLLILEKSIGILVITVPETAFDITRDDHLLDEFSSLLYAKLLTSRRLRKTKNSLKFDINTLIYLAPDVQKNNYELENPVARSLESLSSHISKIESSNLNNDDIQDIRSVIEGFRALSRTRPRDTPSDGSAPKAEVLKKLEEEIANFDAHQRRAALTVAIGPQRIRGLAGSGKTIVLAWKAAHILLTDPSKKILFTFYTKSLYDLIRKQITRFYRHFRDSDPDWENLHVLHAWGGTREAGVYYNTCIDHGIIPKRWSDSTPFKSLCEDLTKKLTIQAKYDVALVDEAQDLPDSFFQLLFMLTKGNRDDKSIIWAYDEFQSIFEPKMRTAAELFGCDQNGVPNIDLNRSAKAHGLGEFVSNDLVLYKCYRNPLDVLVCGHAIGLGIYGPNIVQMLEDKGHWEDVGYEVIQGNFVEGSPTIVQRPSKNSPLSILDYENKDELIKCYKANSFLDELEWIINESISLISGGVRPDEILIICLDDRNAKNYFQNLTEKFFDRGYQTHDVLTNPFSSSHFKSEDKITLSTVHKAKGNEAAVVFVCGLDAVIYNLSGRKARNRVFTAFTRTKCWLRVSGLTPAEPLFSEIRSAISNSPKLIFNWPDLAEVETIQRDISIRQREARKLRDDYVKKMIDLGYSEEDAFAASETAEKTL